MDQVYWFLKENEKLKEERNALSQQFEEAKNEWKKETERIQQELVTATDASAKYAEDTREETQRHLRDIDFLRLELKEEREEKERHVKEVEALKMQLEGQMRFWSHHPTEKRIREKQWEAVLRKQFNLLLTETSPSKPTLRVPSWKWLYCSNDDPLACAGETSLCGKHAAEEWTDIAPCNLELQQALNGWNDNIFYYERDQFVYEINLEKMTQSNLLHPKRRVRQLFKRKSDLEEKDFLGIPGIPVPMIDPVLSARDSSILFDSIASITNTSFSDGEFTALCKLFYQPCSCTQLNHKMEDSYRLLGIYKIINRALLRNYVSYRLSRRTFDRRTLDQLFLFHGPSKVRPELIATRGLDFRHHERGRYLGNAAYASECSVYSLLAYAFSLESKDQLLLDFQSDQFTNDQFKLLYRSVPSSSSSSSSSSSPSSAGKRVAILGCRMAIGIPCHLETKDISRVKPPEHPLDPKYNGQYYGGTTMIADGSRIFGGYHTDVFYPHCIFVVEKIRN